MATFTFKTEKPTGRYSSFFPCHHYIKIKGVEVGKIDDKKPHRIRLKVIKNDINEDGNPNCEWRWIALKSEFESLQEAKDFLKARFDSINNKYNLKTEKQ